MTLSDEQRKQIEKEAMKEYAPFEVMECFRDQQYDIDAAKINRAIKEKRDAYIKGAESYATLCQQKDEEIEGLKDALSSSESIADGLEKSKQLLDDEIARLRSALEIIAFPLIHLQKLAEEQGVALNGQYAISISNDANWLKNQALEALKPI